MTFQFSRHGLTGRDQLLQRAWEIMPGAASWTILLGMAGLALWQPLAAAIIMIAFYLYWLLRIFYMTLFLVLAYLRLALEKGTAWMSRVEDVDQAAAGSPGPMTQAAPCTLGRRLSSKIHQRILAAVRASPTRPPSSSTIFHVVVISVAKEGRVILEPGIRSLAAQTFPTTRLLVVLALEARAPAAAQADVHALRGAFRSRFWDLLVVVHPDGVPGEARVKGANVTHAAKAAAAWLTDRQIPLEQVVISCFDADTVVGPDYLACLTYHFLTCPDRTQASFQPIPVYHNNIWDAPGFARVLDIGSSFFQLIEATDPTRLVTFSSHSMSFKALVEVGYWPVDMISDDSAIFWKALVHFDGRYRVVPMYTTLSMDVTNAGSWWRTAVNVYRQKRRWAWGVENFPLVMRAFWSRSPIPWSQRLRHTLKLLEGHVAWATWPLLLAVIGWCPALFAGREFSSTVLYYSAPRVTGLVFHLASLSLITTIVLSLCLLPRRPARHPILQRLGHALEWLIVPLVAVIFSALPALDAQTRLALGRYMEFWVTDKTRRRSPFPSRLVAAPATR